MADEQEETERSKRVGFDFDAFAYVADKGPLTAFGLEGENVDTFWYHSLRIVGMKKGYSCCAGVPGFYLVNKANAPVDTSSVCHTLPASHVASRRRRATCSLWAALQVCAQWQHLRDVHPPPT